MVGDYTLTVAGREWSCKAKRDVTNSHALIIIKKLGHGINGIFMLFSLTQEYLMNLFENYVDNGLNFARKKCVQAMQQVTDTLKFEKKDYRDHTTRSRFVISLSVL